MNINTNFQSPAFKSVYIVDTGSAQSKSQILTLGALMNNFWVNNAGATFTRIRSTAVYGKVEVNVKDAKDQAFEAVLKNNGISYQKKNTTGLNYKV